MAQITHLTEETTIANGDYIPFRDTSATRDRRILWSNIKNSIATAFAQTLLDNADAATARSTLGLGTIATATETNYLLVSGARAGASSSLQTFTSGIVTGIVRPASDSTTAVRVQNAAGTANIVTVDTTTGYVGINGTPSARLTVEDTVAPMFVNRNTALTNQLAAVLDLRHTTSGDMVDGFGPAFNFSIVDTAGVTNNVVRFGGIRAGADNTGAFAVQLLTSGSLSEAMRLTNDGRIGLVNTAPTSFLHSRAATTAASSLCLPVGVAPTTPVRGDIWNDGASRFVFFNENSATSTITDTFCVRRGSTGTVLDGFGLAIIAQLESSTTAGRDAGRLLWRWGTATDASRASIGQISSYYTTTERPAITWGANSSGALLSFYDVTTPIARQVLATGAGASVDDVISALQAIGLVKQS